MNLTADKRKIINRFQADEISGYHIYNYFAKQQKKHPENQSILHQIANDELKHYNLLKEISGDEIKPNRLKILKFKIFSRLMGPTFAIKLLEKAEESDALSYQQIEEIPGITQIINDEEEHEHQLIEMLNEERLNYIGSMVLGLNDALVELTGALAGLTFALQNPQLIALTGTITGIAASFSMAASEYLSTKSEENEKKALRASWYTGIAYIFTVFFLILPYLILDNVYVSLTLTLTIAVAIIAIFNYYYAIVKSQKFSTRFFEMTILSFSVAALSFGVGWILRSFLGIEV